MKRSWKPAIIGAAGAVIALLLISVAYAASRHWLASGDELLVLGKTVTPSWTSVPSPPAGLGLVTDATFLTNANTFQGTSPRLTSDQSAVIANASGAQHVQLKSGDVKRIDTRLVSRKIVNRFGATVLEWHCSVQGAITRDGKQWYLSLLPQGGGDAGNTVRLSGQRQADANFRLTIVERLWSSHARKCEIDFRIQPDGTLVPIKNGAAKI